MIIVSRMHPSTEIFIPHLSIALLPRTAPSQSISIHSNPSLLPLSSPVSLSLLPLCSPPSLSLLPLSHSLSLLPLSLTPSLSSLSLFPSLSLLSLSLPLSLSLLSTAPVAACQGLFSSGSHLRPLHPFLSLPLSF